MRPEHADELANAVLATLLGGGRRLLDADSGLIASGPPGQLAVRAIAGAPAVTRGLLLTERAPVPDGGPVRVRLDRVAPDHLVLAPVDGNGQGSYAAACSTGGARVLLVAEAVAAAPDRRAMDLLLTTAAAVLSAERSAVSDVIREGVHQREEERLRWARELHDETLQQLGALQVLLTSALPNADGPSAVATEAMRQATDLVAAQINGLRQLITELRPAALADLGLTPPLQALARRCQQLSGIPVTLHVSLRYADGAAHTRLLPDVELAVYRVVQEALTNIRRHSTATRIVVTVIEDDEAVVAEISDNGQGFDAGRAAGFGLSGMVERAEIAQGGLEVLPTGLDGRGTTVRLVVPAKHR